MCRDQGACRCKSRKASSGSLSPSSRARHGTTARASRSCSGKQKRCRLRCSASALPRWCVSFSCAPVLPRSQLVSLSLSLCVLYGMLLCYSSLVAPMEGTGQLDTGGEGMQWVADVDSSTGAPLGRTAVYFFCGHAFDEAACERSVDTGAFICSVCQNDESKQRARRSAEADEVRSHGPLILPRAAWAPSPLRCATCSRAAAHTRPLRRYWIE